MSDFFCLGLKFLGNSSYDPSSPTRVYFSIGEAVAALAMVLMVIQLLRPIIRFRLKTKTGFFLSKKSIYFFFILGIASVFIASVLPFIPGPALPLLGYPVFWEFFAGILMCLFIITFFLSSELKTKFNSKNYKLFYDNSFSLIAKGNNNDLRELAEEIYVSIKNIICAGKEYDRLEGNKNNVSEYAIYAINLLNIWSDPGFCEIIVCHALNTAYEIFSQIEKQKFYNSGGYSFINQLVKQAYLKKFISIQRRRF